MDKYISFDAVLWMHEIGGRLMGEICGGKTVGFLSKKPVKLSLIHILLEAVPHSIAMGVCSKTILPYCSYRTTPVLEDGIANALKHYGLI